MRERQSIALVTRHGISTPDARTTTSRRSCRDPRRAIRGLQGAAQGYCRGCADEAAGGCPVPSACRSAQSTGTVGLAGQPALEPGRQRDGGSARCRAGAARSCRRSSGGRVTKRLRPGLMALVNGATRHASDRSKGGCSPQTLLGRGGRIYHFGRVDGRGAVHISHSVTLPAAHCMPLMSGYP